MNLVSTWRCNLRKLSVTTVAGLAMALSLLCGSASVAATLPVPCAAASCAGNKTPGFTAPTGFVTSGQATATQSGNTLTVSQTSNQAILNWSSFNVSADGKVVFNQPGATSIALNKIYQANPSTILGQVSANGQIYLINPNGFVFGANATVNVAGLVASSLGLTQGDSELAAGILSPAATTPAPQSAFSSDGRIYVTDSSGNLVLDAQGNKQPVQIVVQQGAQLNAADGGRVLLAGQNVTNGGTLTAPDGQVILAAGQSVYLQASPSSDPTLRGLVVEVGGNTAATPTSAGTGTTTNLAGGLLSAARGNVSLMGLAVNQSGRISATTAVTANGSVILQAGDYNPLQSGTGCNTGETLCVNQGGTLKVAATSEIDVLPDLTDTTTAVVAQAQVPSTIKLTGQEVDIEGGQITAPGGTLKVLAAANPDLGLVTNGNSAAQIQVDAGASINLAGSDAVLPMSANLLSIQLRSNELEDDPLQRNGALEAQTVIVDIRDGKPPLISEASWQSALQGIEENILQRTSGGGSASFQSEGSVVVSKGATVNVSGGQWTYQSGVTQTSQLIGANGQTYNIATADPSLAYTGVLNPTYTQSYSGFGVQITGATPGLGHTEAGYSDGFSAGTVTFAAPALALQGSLVGTAVNGPYQRSAASIPSESLMGFLASTTGGNGIAMGGTLVIGEATPLSVGGLPDFFSPAVTFVANASPVIVAEGAPLPPQVLQLPTSYITSGGFTQTQIYSDSIVTLPTGLPLNLGAGGSLAVVAPHILIGSDIEAAGGNIDLQSAQTAAYVATGLPRMGIDITNGVTLDVRGQWTNDSPDAPASAVAPAYQNGGQIDLSLTSSFSPLATGAALVLGNNVSLEASGGAWVEANNTVLGGTGGKITLDATPYQSALQVGSNVSLDAFGVQGAAGGSFTLAAPRITIDQGTAGVWAPAQQVDDLLKPGGTFDIGASLFSQFGFSSVSLTATAPLTPVPPATTVTSTDVLTVETGTSISAQAESLQLIPGYLTRASGGGVESFTQAQLLPEAMRNPYTINLQVVPATTDPHSTVIGDLLVQQGASITADPGSTLTLTGEGSVVIDGTLRAPGGTITAQITAPDTFVDPGYLPNQVLELGAQGVLDVSGTTILTPNSLNLPLGTVLAGGSINLLAARGDIVADAGSSMAIQGASALLDVQTIGGAGGYQKATVGSEGGSLTVESVESISLLGSLSAAGGASSTGKLAGGTLEVEVVPSVFAPGSNASGAVTTALPSAPATIELVSSAAGSTATASYGNLAVLGIEQLAESGIDALILKSDNTIALDSNTALTMGREVSLDAPVLSVSYGTSAAINAPYVALSNSNVNLPSLPPALGGTGALNVSAQQIVLSGNTTLQGVANATLNSSGDVQLEPLGSGQLSGSLNLAGNLTIDAARLYPATQTAFTINDSGSAGTVTIGQTNASPGTPLSVAGSLTIDATNIVSSGTILAPFGEISLNATNSLSLQDGSVTSVSAAGATLLYGQTVLGQTQWVYDGTIPVNGVPTRQVSLTAPNVSFASGATIDVSGGGNLSAYEFTAGTGGSVDALGQASANAAGLYAVLPSTVGQYASYDVQEFTGSAVKAGESVYLSGVTGLPAGIYPLLPARYALLPGAYLVQVEPGYHSLTSGTLGKLTDGTPVVAGYTTFGTTGLQNSSGYTGFAIRPGSYAQSLAQYTISSASSYFATPVGDSTSTPVLPADAGTLLFAASNSLSALGKVNSAAGSGGTAATIEISSSDLTVTASSSSGTGATGSAGVSIAAPVIQSWNAGDLILGGQLAADGSGLIVTAQNVTIGSGAQFSAGQVLAVADNSIEVQAGANVASTSGISGVAPKTLPAATALNLVHADPTTSALVADSGAAMLAVSDLGLPMVTRAAGSTTGGSGTGSGGTSNTGGAGTGLGTVQIDSGATLSTLGAVALDAPGKVAIAGTIDAPGASWSLASNSIGFVGASGSSADTLQINPALSAQMQTAGSIQLTAAGSIDLLTNVTLGAASASATPTLGSLGLTASSINNFAGGTSVFGAQTLVLQGVASGGSNAGGSPAAPTAGTGTLTFVAGTLDIGAPNSATAATSGSGNANTPAPNLLINGNSQTTLQVNGAVVGQGTLDLGIAGNATIAATELTAASGSATSVSVPDGTLSIVQNGTADKPSALSGSLGGQLSLSANAIQDSGTIIVPGGRISLSAAVDPNAANGSGSALIPANITLGSSAVIDASGIAVSQGNETIGAAGGFISLTAAGDLTLPAGSLLSVSGASAPGGDAPAGFLSLTGGGVVTLGASLAGNAAADATGGGSFVLDAGQLVGGLPGLTASLTAAGTNPTTGGFTNEIDIRVRNGDLDSEAGTTLTANQISLTADTGTIDIAGTLNAPSAGLRGSIGLFGGTGVTLESSGALLANGSGSTGRGGEIELSTVQGAVTLDSGSVISASGTAQGGSLLLRAPALMSSGDVAISNINSTVTGLAQLTIEPVLTTVISSGDLGADFTQQVEPLVSSYLSQVQASGTLAPRFSQAAGGSALPPATIEPGVVVDATGDISLSQEIDLYSLQKSAQLGAPIDLTVRATGNVTIGGTISDGVSGNVLSSTPSSSIRLVAGADLNSANPLATVAGSGADLTLTNNALVRTGTGDIDLVAANDIDINAGSSAYTMGTPGVASVLVRLPSQATINAPTGGGNVVVKAGEDVVGADQLDPESASNWQTRSSTGALGFYGVNLTAFDNDPWSLATFGGGDVSVIAARDVMNVSAGASDSVSLTGTTQTHFASGGMSVVAGRDVTTGQFFVADGIGSFTAGRSFATSPDIQTPTKSVGTIFELGDAQLSVWAQGNIAIDGIINPTVLTQPLASSGAASKVYFYTYTGSSAFSAQSASGTVTLTDDPNTVGALLGSAVGNSGNDAIGVYPASLSLVALTSNLDLSNDIGTLFPSDNGQLRLFAGRDIIGGSAGALVSMSDAPDVAIQAVSNVTGGIAGVTQIANLGATNVVYDFFSGRHVNDSTPASIVAGRDIDDLTLSIPKASDIVAGRDIVSLIYNGQNLNPNDVTLISAGRDFIDPPQVAASTGLINTAVSGVVSVGGPGQLDILAGRNLDLGFSEGVTTIGDLRNPNLPTSTGASITMLAGLGQKPDDSGFLQSIIEPSTTYQSELVSYVESLTGQSSLSASQADTEFTGLSQAAQQSLVDNVFFNELNLSGLEAEKAGGPGYSRGYAAIDALFPDSRTTPPAGTTPPYQGDLSLSYSQIYTLAGGDISLLVPGGDINVGLASPPTGSATIKAPNQLGIVAQGSGNVSIYSQGDVNVNSSRIFTIGGGNIVIWSDEGNIDAGNGAKTSLSLPPPTFTTDAAGNEVLVFGAAVAGSGIRTIQTNPSQPAGDVNLIAPTGSVNAGDAGIGAAGNINIAAVTVTGASNINFGGSATGVPPAVSNVTASVSGASTAASATTNAATALEATAANTQAAPLAQSAISWLDVFVTGLGDENCKPEDEECLRRQKVKE